MTLFPEVICKNYVHFSSPQMIKMILNIHLRKSGKYRSIIKKIKITCNLTKH